MYFVGFATQDVAECNPGYTVPFPSHSKMARRQGAVAETEEAPAVQPAVVSF
jgi:hypothetical protein